MAKQNNTKVVTGIVRLSYANIWDPKAPVSGGDPRYSCSLIIPKSDTETVDAINRAMVRIRGSYALAIMFRDIPGEIWVARKDSPLIIGCDVRNMDETTRKILTNLELIAINQDPECRSCHRLSTYGSPDAFILVRQMSEATSLLLMAMMAKVSST